MIGTVLKGAMDILNRNWLKIIGMVLLIYLIKLVIGTLPIQGTLSIKMDPLAVATSETLQSLLIGAFVNSILFFILIQYITLTKNTMGNRWMTAITYPFRNARLLYKGVIIFVLNNLLIYFIGMLIIYTGIGAVVIAAAGWNVRTGIVILIYLVLYAILFWLYLGISQTMYLLHDDPKLGIFRSIKNSFSLMKGYRWSLLGLFLLTGIALIIGVFLFVIGAIFSLVLYEVARLAFYQELLRKKRQKEWHDKVNDEEA
ncbi:DUF975 family protein [Oceanobacillus halophilus]|uniref:DUF975 family protein n=1 Tax=Oceanobacillus halophilus TaxID=930130 RepID=A0A495A333_9BACI|nr:DUF975 family protein [Oceanobacillus halophilus]RKQ33982.1 DUF975 family protein [Oceanobacillus halophilus]